MNTNPSYYGLSPRIKLKQLADGQIGIVKKIKSRIIQQDTLKIIEMADIIKEKDPSLKVSLICNDNICSKSVKLLIDNNIDIVR